MDKDIKELEQRLKQSEEQDQNTGPVQSPFRAPENYFSSFTVTPPSEVPISTGPLESINPIFSRRILIPVSLCLVVLIAALIFFLPDSDAPTYSPLTDAELDNSSLLFSIEEDLLGEYAFNDSPTDTTDVLENYLLDTNIDNSLIENEL